MGANYQKLHKFTPFQFIYYGTWSEDVNMYRRKNYLINFTFVLPISIEEIVYFAHAQ